MREETIEETMEGITSDDWCSSVSTMNMDETRLLGHQSHCAALDNDVSITSVFEELRWLYNIPIDTTNAHMILQEARNLPESGRRLLLTGGAYSFQLVLTRKMICGKMIEIDAGIAEELFIYGMLRGTFGQGSDSPPPNQTTLDLVDAPNSTR